MTRHQTAERLGEWLLPPASAEHVLGDLAESSRTSSQYLRRLLAALPYVVLAQVRRRAGTGVPFNALHSAFIFAVSQWLASSPDIDSPVPWSGLLSVWVTWVGGCALAAAYGPRDKPMQWNPFVLCATVVVTLGVGLASGLSTLAVAFADVFVLATSPVMSMPWLSPWMNEATRMQQRLLFGIDEKAPFRMALMRHFCMWGAGWPGVSLLTSSMAQVPDGRGFLWLLAAFGLAATILGRTWGGLPRPNPERHEILEFHRIDIGLRLRLLRVPFWLFVPGPEFTIARAAVRHPESVVSALPVVAAAVVTIWWMHLLATRFLERQLEQLTPLAQSEAIGE